MAIKTWAELLVSFANNNAGAITAERLRDFVETTENEIGKGPSRAFQQISIQNSGGQLNVRIPDGAGGGIQFDYNPAATAIRTSASQLAIPAANAPYLRSFASGVKAFAALSPTAGDYTGVTRESNSFNFTSAAASAGPNVVFISTSGPVLPTPSEARNCLVIAFGTYGP